MKVLIKKSTLKDIADAIREQDGDNAVIKPVDFPERITNILTGAAPEEIVIHNLGEISSMAPETTVALQVQILPDCAKQVYSVSSSNPAVAYAEQDPDTKIWSVTGVSEGETTLTFTAGKITKTIQTQVVVYHGPVEPTSLAELKQALKSGADILIGTEIPDKYDGNDNPLIVAQNLNSTNNSSYGGAEGVILVRKNLVTPNQTFSWNNTSDGNYLTSKIKAYLNGTYYNNCSSELKSLMSDIAIPLYNGGMISVVGKCFLPSCTEMGGVTIHNQAEGVFWDYWRQKTGLSNPSNSANSGRSFNGRVYWLRSQYSGSRAYAVGVAGVIDSSQTGAAAYPFLPACFVSKD